MQSRSKLYSLALFALVSSALTGCTGVPQSVDANPEFRKQMEGRTIGEATGDPALWGQTEESIARKILPGRTTKSEVRTMLGATTKVSLTESGETWVYESSVVTIFTGASYIRNMLLVLFDENGIVKRYSMNVDKR